MSTKKVEAFQCEKCEELFLKEGEYNKHLREHVKKEKEFLMREAARKHNESLKQGLIDLVSNSETIQEVEENLEKAVEEWARLFPKDFDKNGLGDAGKATKIKLDVHYSEHVSNSHNCPNKGGVINWDRRKNKDLPTGYPGFRGRIRFFSKGGYANTNILNRLGVKTGTGGGGGSNSNYGYDVILFLADFPKLAKIIEEREQVCNELEKNAEEVEAAVEKWVDTPDTEGELAHTAMANQANAVAEMQRELRELEERYREIVTAKAEELDAGKDAELTKRLNALNEKLRGSR